MSEYRCTEKESFNNITKNVDKNTEDIIQIKDDITMIKINDKGVEIIVANLQNSLDKIVESMDKLKWWILTGMLGPIILAFVLAKLNL